MEHRQDLSVDQSLNDATSTSRPLAPGGSRDVGGVERDFVVHNERPSTARTYRDMTANDNSRVHAGDVYNYNCISASASTKSNIDSSETKVRRLRSALSYPQMGLRSAIVEDACLDTCQWLFNTPEYQRWRDPTLYSKHHGFLWIKGKPGSGKSTAMKTLLSSAESSGDMRSEKVLSYFFNSRGEALERSTEGLYRSLLHQITAGIASLPDDVLRWSNPDSLHLFRRQGWQVDLLKSLFKKVVLLDRRGHLLCFIDALDEGDNERSVRDMVEFLEDRRTDLLWILLEWGVDVNASFPACRMGCSRLILAARTCGRQSLRSDYFRYNGDLRGRIRTFKKNEDHSTPKMGLRDIRFRDKIADIEILLAFGATVNAKCNRCGMTAMKMAEREQNIKVQCMLQRYGEKIYEVYQSVAQLEN